MPAGSGADIRVLRVLRLFIRQLNFHSILWRHVLHFSETTALAWLS